MLTSTERRFLPFSVAVLRNKDLHEKHLQQLQENPEARSSTGVEKRSILCDSQYYEWTQNFIFDKVHDGFEGG